MGKRKKTIKNLDQLDTEIYRRKLRVKELAFQLDKQWDYLHDHFLSMLAESMARQKNPVSGVLQTILANENVQQALQRASGHLADKAAEGMESIMSRFSKKKETDK